MSPILSVISIVIISEVIMSIVVMSLGIMAPDTAGSCSLGQPFGQGQPTL